MPRYHFHLLPEDGLPDIEFRFADDTSAFRTAEVVLREQQRGRRDLTKVIEVIREDGTSLGFAEALRPTYEESVFMALRRAVGADTMKRDSQSHDQR